MSPLPVLAARYVLGFVPTEILPLLASQLLAFGDAFTELAGMSSNDHPSDLRDLFETALEASGAPLPERMQAAGFLRDHAAEEIAATRLNPVEGAAEILEAFFAIRDTLPESFKAACESFDIADVALAYYALDSDAPEARPDDLRTACQALHDRHP